MTNKQKTGLGALLLAAFGLVATLGVGWPHGRDAQRSIGGEFDPKEFNVIYLKFGSEDGAAPLQVRHAFFKIQPGYGRYSNKKGGQQDAVPCAISYLENGGPLEDEENGDSRERNDCGVVTRTRSDKIPVECTKSIGKNFECLKYFHQTRVYVYIDNPDMAFNETTPMSFTPFGAHDKASSWPWKRTRDKNRSFGSADMETYGAQLRGKRLLYVQNHHNNSWGWRMKDGDEETEYSINFNLLACEEREAGKEDCNFSDVTDVFPIIVDPDTGNGNDG